MTDRSGLDQFGLDKNFRFMVLEVNKQLERTQRHLQSPSDKLAEEIKNRDNYIDHLKSIIQNTCFSYFIKNDDLDKKTVNLFRAADIIAANLERIGDHAVNIVTQTTHLTNPRFFQRYPYVPFFEVIGRAIKRVQKAFDETDPVLAVKICEAEEELDTLYRAKIDRILAELVTGKDVPNLVTSLFIFHYLERIGDALLNIGEAVLFARMGERLKFHQYQSLQNSVSTMKGDVGLEGVDFEGIWGTRSGCRIGKVSDPEGTSDARRAVYKEGEVKKIRQEKEKLDIWNELFPGLSPSVVSYQESDHDAALLIEYLEGRNLQDIVVNPEPDLLEEALEEVQLTLREIWLDTAQVEEIKPRFLKQIHSRLADIQAVHPSFGRERKQIGGMVIPSFGDILERNLWLDDKLSAPFSVLGHGDFNLDNIIYNPDTKRVHYIDVHRSRRMDYIQDISVLLVSSFRLPVFERRTRSRLNSVIEHFLSFVSSFAKEREDESFELRLTLGLVRSFATSIRFELNHDFANTMGQRAVYLMKNLDRHLNQDRLEQFRLPWDVLFYN